MRQTNALTNSEVALLGLLSEKAKHAYQIGRDAEHRAMRSWTDLSQSTIYRQLTFLHKAGLAESKQAVVDGRARKVCSLTDAGLEALRDRLLNLLADPEAPTWGIDLATYNVGLVPANEAAAALQRYREKLQAGIACREATEENMGSCSCPTHGLAVVRRPRYLLEAEIRWVDDFVAELTKADHA